MEKKIEHDMETGKVLGLGGFKSWGIPFRVSLIRDYEP